MIRVCRGEKNLHDEKHFRNHVSIKGSTLILFTWTGIATMPFYVQGVANYQTAKSFTVDTRVRPINPIKLSVHTVVR